MLILYHASQNKELTVLEPKRTLSKNKYIGDFVFATKNKVLATMYLAARGHAALMDAKAEQPHIVICADKGEYMNRDNGGAIYELSLDSFIASPHHELSDYELVSKVSVTPLKKTIYKKSLDAMLASGITIHFVDKQTFDSLIGHPRQAELIKQLPRYRN